jgi:hypothetical protein
MVRQFPTYGGWCGNILGLHCIHLCVAEPSPFRVHSAELFRDGVIVTFADGKSALFSADFLRASLPQAQDLTDQDAEGDHLSLNQSDTAGGAGRE